MGSGCYSVCIEVTFYTRGPQFKSSDRQNVYLLYWKDENKEKEAWNGPSQNSVKAKINRDHYWELQDYEAKWFVPPQKLWRKNRLGTSK